jgi:hypothetical protein
MADITQSSTLFFASLASLNQLKPKISHMALSDLNTLRYHARDFSTNDKVREFFAVDYLGNIETLLDAGPKAPPEFLKTLENSPHSKVAQMARAAIDNSKRSAESLHQDACSGDFMRQLAVAKNPYAQESDLRFLANLQSTQIMLALGANQSTPHDLLSEYSDSDIPGLAATVAQNPGTPESVLLTYPDGGDYSKLLLKNPAASEKVLLEILAHSKREPQTLLNHPNATYTLAQSYMEKYPDSLEESQATSLRKKAIFKESFPTLFTDNTGENGMLILTALVDFTYDPNIEFDKIKFLINRFEMLKDLPDSTTRLLLSFFTEKDMGLLDTLSIVNAYVSTGDTSRTAPKLTL